MSLSSFLLSSASDKGKGKAIDTGLDELFRKTANAQSPAANVAQNAPVRTLEKDKKRKLHEAEAETASSSEVKRAKSDKKVEVESKVPKKSKKSKSHMENAREVVTELPSPSKKPSETQKARDSKEDSSDEEGDLSKLVHETLAKVDRPKNKEKLLKYVPPDETAQQRDLRTIFVGNVPIEVVKSKPLTKQFKRHFLSFVPEAKIESVRFRSVAFSKPTAPPTTDDTKSQSKPRQHDQERIASWRAKQKADDSDDEPAAPAKVFLTPTEKRKVAFIKQDFHSQVDSVNAYVVFAHPVPLDAVSRPSNVPPPKPVMDPYEAARVVAEKADGSVFLEHTIRVDVVGQGAKGQGAMKGDPKKTVFVGNLDFASKEQDLRVFFESLITKERGPPSQSDESDSENEDEEKDEKRKAEGVRKPPSWVKRVRIVRDKDTQMGKGFAYVQFAGRECVDEILALEPEHLKFAKRKLRVQRCKTLPGGTNKVKITTKPAKPSITTAPGSNAKPTPRAHKASASSAKPIIVPKGDPSLGSKLVGMSKEERKKVKASDPDRLARRLAKKKAKALAEKGVKSKDAVKERVRKRGKDKDRKQDESKKKRVRSGNALLKMNTKK